ncbi:uncharacterized protein LOC130157470 [Falco biarmicus]|uniref:uncharacterized protein LOC130157470 n=1 Tax=Falco biarmicus TaxID=345155 RepID=UPI0024BD4A21|nr:uncharacterized protein LOC130157470 [Falco biarmicus]XP_056213073.1 uncharacterized protein LOC130157470 [Falco biarmicus]XP_056213074.1 uncharacterized protein LOC130157470 [Falco biarmicus]
MTHQMSMVTEGHSSWTVSMCSPPQRQPNGTSDQRNPQSIYSVCHGPQSPSQHLTPHFRAVAKVKYHKRNAPQKERSVQGSPQASAVAGCDPRQCPTQLSEAVGANEEGSTPQPVVSILSRENSLLPTDLVVGLNAGDMGTGSQIYLVTNHVFSLATHSPVLPWKEETTAETQPPSPSKAEENLPASLQAVWDYCHTGRVPTSADPTSSQICLAGLKSPSTMEGGDLGVVTSLGLKAGEQLPASHLWFPIPGYQRGVKCVCTKATPVPLPQQLGAEAGNLPIPRYHFPTGDSRPPCTISSSHLLSHK